MFVETSATYESIVNGYKEFFEFLYSNKNNNKKDKKKRKCPPISLFCR